MRDSIDLGVPFYMLSIESQMGDMVFPLMVNINPIIPKVLHK